VVDRRGIIVPLGVGLAASALLIASLPLPQEVLPLAVLSVLALGGPLVGAIMGAISLMTDAVERIGAALAFGTMLLNLAWAIGETVGAPTAAWLSRATNDSVPLVLLAATMLLTLLPVLRLRPRHARARPLDAALAAEASSAGGASSADSGRSIPGTPSRRRASGGL
jgi:hypothetical protein